MFRAILIPFLILSLAALGLNILVGYCGQISLGTGAFMAVGAYAAYNFFVRIDGMPLIVWRSCWAACAPPQWACCSASPALRIKGLYLAVATLAAQFFCDWAFLRIKWFTNDSASGSVSGGRPARAGHGPYRHAGEPSTCSAWLSWWCLRCWPRTWCAATSAASGWPSATWTWPRR
jgi:ABC-type branched-subunit amino acid transport system permease subunit